MHLKLNTCMIKLIRTNSENPDFIKLVKFLDADLALRDGEDHLFYSHDEDHFIGHPVISDRYPDFKEKQPIFKPAITNLRPKLILAGKFGTVSFLMGRIFKSAQLNFLLLLWSILSAGI